MAPSSVFIVDDSSLMRQRLRLLFGRRSELEVVGEAVSAEEFLEAYPRLRPEIVTVDISLPGMSGLALVAALKADPEPPLVVVITNYPYPGFRMRSLEVGADLFLSKSAPPDEIAKAVAALATPRDAGDHQGGSRGMG